VPRLADHRVEFGVFVALFALAAVLGYAAARWRRPATFDDIDEWGLGGRSFGPWVSWFLLSGELYTAYTFVALPALMYSVGAAGFFAVPFAVIAYPLVFVPLTRMWSVAHVHGLVTPADFVRARFGSPGLALLVALTGIVATMPYIALQLVGFEAVLQTVGIPGRWPLTVAFAVLAVLTYRAGLRAPAMIAFFKDILFACVALAALVIIITTWDLFRAVDTKFAATPSRADGLLLNPANHLNYVTLALGSALALFLYPHAITGVLAAKNRDTVRRSIAALPIWTLMLGLMALLGFVAIAEKVTPIGTGPAASRNTVVPALFQTLLPDWYAGIAYAAIGVGALVPAAVMSIAAANLFTRNIYREYLRPHASPATEAKVSRVVSLLVKLGAVAFIVFVDPQFSIDLQLIGGVIILQTLPAVGLGLYTNWLHRYALVAGLVAGLATGVAMLYQIPQPGPDGRTVVRAHFGGSAWPLSHIGVHNGQAVYVGLVAVAVNLAVAVAATHVLRTLQVPDGVDITGPGDYLADEGDPSVRRLAELVDGGPTDSILLRRTIPRHEAEKATPRHRAMP
jgi:solute:Na+ symporter, SSS family